MAVGDVGLGAPLYRKYATAPDTSTSHVPGFTFRGKIGFPFLYELQESRVLFVRSLPLAVERRDLDRKTLHDSLPHRHVGGTTVTDYTAGWVNKTFQ